MPFPLLSDDPVNALYTGLARHRCLPCSPAGPVNPSGLIGLVHAAQAGHVSARLTLGRVAGLAAGLGRLPDLAARQMACSLLALLALADIAHPLNRDRAETCSVWLWQHLDAVLAEAAFHAGLLPADGHLPTPAPTGQAGQAGQPGLVPADLAGPSGGTVVPGPVTQPGRGWRR